MRISTDPSSVEPLLMRSASIRMLPFSPEQVSATYLRWLEDPVVNHGLEVRFQKHSLESLRQYVSSFNFKSSFLFAIHSLDDSQPHIGNVTLYYDVNHRTVAFGYLLGDKRYWGTSASTECLLLTFDFVFEKLGARKIWGNAYRSNLGSVFNFRKFGFVREGVMRGHLLVDGKPMDSLVYGLLLEEWLKERQRFSHIPRSIE